MRQNLLSNFLPVVAGTAIFSVPVVLNGSPTLFPDSTSYYSQGREIVGRVVKIGGPAQSQGVSSKQQPPDPKAEAAAEEKKRMASTVLGGRSAYYGIVLFSLDKLGTLWLLAAAQALLTSLTLLIGLRALVPEAGRAAFAGLAALLAVTSGLSFFIGYAMPDLFGGLAVLAGGVLLCAWPRLRRGEHVFLAAMIALAAMFHLMNLAVLGASLPVVMVVAWIRTRQFAWRPILTIGTALIVAVTAGQAFKVAAQRASGYPILAPPFLSARFIGDGPARDYLRKACQADRSAYELCRYPAALTTGTLDFLWSTDPTKGVYSVADYGSRIRLIDEQWRFAIHAVVDQPMRQLGASSDNIIMLLTSVDMSEVLVDPAEVVGNRLMVGSSIAQIRAPHLGVDRIRFDATDVNWLYGLAEIVALVAAIALLRPRAGEPAELETLRRFAGWVLLVLIINAGVCGVLSGPWPRYQARLVWLVPMVAAMAVMIVRRYRSTGS